MRPSYWLASVSLLSLAAAGPAQEKPRLLHTLDNLHTDNAAFSPDGKHLAVGNQLWEVSSGKLVRTFQLPRGMEKTVSVAFSSDGRKLALSTGILYHNWVCLFDISNDEPLWVKKAGLGANAGRVVFAPGDEGLLTNAGDKDNTPVKDVQLLDLKTGKPVRTFGADRYATELALSRDGKLLAAVFPASKEEQTIWLWDYRTGKLLDKLKVKEPSYCWALTFSPDGKSLLAIGREATGVWDVAERKLTRTLSHPAPADWPVSCALSPDGKRLAIGPMLLDAATGKLTEKLTDLEKTMSWVVFSPTGKHIALSARKQTRIWALPEK
jgi:WD40 repeat protein